MLLTKSEKTSILSCSDLFFSYLRVHVHLVPHPNILDLNFYFILKINMQQKLTFLLHSCVNLTHVTTTSIIG